MKSVVRMHPYEKAVDRMHTMVRTGIVASSSGSAPRLALSPLLSCGEALSALPSSPSSLGSRSRSSSPPFSCEYVVHRLP
jgi:hypothetical protein